MWIDTISRHNKQPLTMYFFAALLCLNLLVFSNCVDRACRAFFITLCGVIRKLPGHRRDVLTQICLQNLLVLTAANLYIFLLPLGIQFHSNILLNNIVKCTFQLVLDGIYYFVV